MTISKNDINNLSFFFCSIDPVIKSQRVNVEGGPMDFCMSGNVESTYIKSQTALGMIMFGVGVRYNRRRDSFNNMA